LQIRAEQDLQTLERSGIVLHRKTGHPWECPMDADATLLVRVGRARSGPSNALGLNGNKENFRVSLGHRLR
jgi:hypothetical protein